MIDGSITKGHDGWEHAFPAFRRIGDENDEAIIGLIVLVLVSDAFQ